MSVGMQQAATVDSINDFEAEKRETHVREVSYLKAASSVVVGIISLFGAFAVVLIVLTHFAV